MLLLDTEVENFGNNVVMYYDAFDPYSDLYILGEDRDVSERFAGKRNMDRRGIYYTASVCEEDAENTTDRNRKGRT